MIPIFTDKQQVEHRLNICKSCEFKRNVTLLSPICKQCGCVISGKVRLANQKCPIGKW